MKKYISFLLFIASCNGLVNSIVYNVDGQGGGNVPGNHQEPSSLKKNLKSKEYLSGLCFEKLKAYYDRIAFFSRNVQNVYNIYRDIQCYLNSGKLPFFPKEALLNESLIEEEQGSCSEALDKAQEIWNKGGSIFDSNSNLKDEYKQCNTLNDKVFEVIPPKVGKRLGYLFANGTMPTKYEILSKGLDLLEKKFFSSFREEEPTSVEQIAILQELLVKHFNEIEQKFCKLPYVSNESLRYAITGISTPFALVDYLGSYAMLDDFLKFIKEKNIKIALNDKQIELEARKNRSIVKYDTEGEGASVLHSFSPAEYLAQQGCVNGLKLLMQCNGVDQNGGLNLTSVVRMASYYRNQELFMMFKDRRVYLDTISIVRLIRSGFSSIVLDFLDQELIEEEALLPKEKYAFGPFIAAIKRYMQLIGNLNEFPLEIYRQELESLKTLLQILINKGVSILESDSGNVLVRTILNSTLSTFRVSDAQQEMIHDLIEVLGKHPDIRKIIHEKFEGRTLNMWVYKYTYKDIEDLFRKSANS